jgi:hypothetical protein
MCLTHQTLGSDAASVGGGGDAADEVPYASRAEPVAGAGAGAAGIEVCVCASFLAQTKTERGATSGLIHKVAVQTWGGAGQGARTVMACGGAWMRHAPALFAWGPAAPPQEIFQIRDG